VKVRPEAPREKRHPRRGARSAGDGGDRIKIKILYGRPLEHHVPHALDTPKYSDASVIRI